MEIRWFRRDFIAWMACFAVLLAALAPPISRLVNAARPADEVHSGHAVQDGKPGDFLQGAENLTDHREHHSARSHDPNGANAVAGAPDPHATHTEHAEHAAH